MTIGGYYTM